MVRVGLAARVTAHLHVLAAVLVYAFIFFRRVIEGIQYDPCARALVNLVPSRFLRRVQNCYGPQRVLIEGARPYALYQ